MTQRLEKTEVGQYGLDRALGLFRATALVVGSVVGSGIFVSSASMARAVGSGSALMAAWALAALMTALGALTQAELASRLPLTGGLYAYFREVFGDTIGFYYGWANFMIAGSGAIAAVAFVFASCVAEIWPRGGLSEKFVGIVVIVGLTALNARGVRLGSRVQSVMAAAKFAAIFIIVAVVAAVAGVRGAPFVGAGVGAGAVGGSGTIGATAWFAALGGAFWAYDGWGNPAFLGGEVRDPRRNLPRSILLGLGLVTILYLSVNLAYLAVLPLGAIAHAPGDRVASAVMVAVAGPGAAAVVTALIAATTFDTLNAAIIANARVVFAMARDGLFWRAAGDVDAGTQAPVVALALQAAWAVVLLVSGSFETLIGMYVFVNWLFYLLIPVALAVLRRRPEAVRPGDDRGSGVFVVPGYPMVPVIFGVLTLVFLARTIQVEPSTLWGLGLVALGTPLLMALKCCRPKP